MISPDDANDVVQRYFKDAPNDQLRADIDRVAGSRERSEGESESRAHQLALLQPVRAPLPLTAYLASALTGLAEAERQLVFQLSDTIAHICKEYGIDLYEPRKATDPVHHADVAPEEVFRIDRERVLSSDLLIHLAHFPSTGAGEELDFAQTSLLPVFLICHGETRVSRMVSGLPGLKVELAYSDPEELRDLLRSALTEVRPVLEQRKLAFSDYDRNMVGEKVRSLREGQGLTREDVVTAVGDWLTMEHLVRIEESSDRVANPNLLELRQVAAALNTTVAELVEPDLSEQLIAIVRDLMDEPAAARFSGVTSRDRRRLLRLLMQRVADSLAEDDDG